MRLFLVEVLSLTASLASASMVKRQTPASVYKGSGWIETIAIRSNSEILVNHLDKPELWTLNATTQAATKLLTFTSATSTTGITEYAPDQFAVVTGNFSTTNIGYTSKSWGVWTVDFRGTSPKATLVKEVPESDFWIGITPLNNDTVFIAEAGKGSIYKMTLSTGDYSVVLSDSSMKAAAGSPISEGIHGIVYRAGYLYYTSTFGIGYYKVKVDPATGETTGAVISIVTIALGNPEGFAIGGDGASYVCDVGKNSIVKVTDDGKLTNVTAAQGCSSVAFGRGEKDKSTLYISTNGGAVLSATIS